MDRMLDEQQTPQRRDLIYKLWRAAIVHAGPAVHHARARWNRDWMPACSFDDIAREAGLELPRVAETPRASPSRGCCPPSSPSPSLSSSSSA